MRKLIVLIFVSIIGIALVCVFIHNVLDLIWRNKPAKSSSIVRYFPFTKENSLKEWEEKIFKGRTFYKVESRKNESYVKADSVKTASALFYKIEMDVKKHPILSWKWKIEEFPKKKMTETIGAKEEEDFAARVYVIFPANFFANSKAIEYIWAEDLPIGTMGRSVYSNNIKLMILEKGASNSAWMSEQRDVYEDYIKLFGENPRLNIGAIAFMTDADSTKTRAISLYDEITIGMKYEN